MSKIILDLCGGTGAWSKPYKDAGYDVRLITLPDNDVRNYQPPENVYGILAAPPCPQFSFAKTTGKPRDLKNGMEIVIACLNIIWKCQYKLKSPQAKETTLKFWAMENPKGLLRRFLGKPVFQFNPYDFGDAYQKHTDLWGYFNEPVKSPIQLTEKQKQLHRTNSQPLAKYMKFDRLKTKEIHPEKYGELSRTERRAITPSGFAKAFFEVNR
jgi:hypothetical protein